MENSIVDSLQEIQNLLNQLATMQLPEADDISDAEIMDILDMNELELSINCMLFHAENNDLNNLKLEIEDFSKILDDLGPYYQKNPVLEQLKKILTAVV